MNVTILLGTVRNGRQSHKAAQYVASTLAERGSKVDLIDLAEEPLPMLGYEPHQNKETEQRIRQISNRLDESDAIILVTPEYQGSFSGALKNALDHYYTEFHKKPVGVVAASAGGMAGINASTQLQHVILSLGAYPLPMKLLVPQVHHAFDDSFEPLNEKIIEMTGKFLDEFSWFAEAIIQKKTVR